MEKRFWKARWERNEIGFHQAEINPFLKRFFPVSAIEKGATVFVPLCGKSSDMLWLAGQGFRVVGVELSELAVRAFFAENGMEAEVATIGSFRRFNSGKFQLFCGDFFKLTGELLGPVSAVYDRASLVALPPEMRMGYARHLAALLAQGTEVVAVSYTYDQKKMPGPPFSVPLPEVMSLFGEGFTVELLASEKISDLPKRFHNAGLAGDISEEVYRLVRL